MQRYTARPQLAEPKCNKVCPYCNHPLIKIDHYSDVLIDCIDCNRWGRPGDKKLIMEMPEDDLSASLVSIWDQERPRGPGMAIAGAAVSGRGYAALSSSLFLEAKLDGKRGLSERE